MNILREISNRRTAVYVAIAVVCVIVIGVAVYFEFFYSANRPVHFITEETSKTPETAIIEELKQNFNSMFNNSLKTAVGESIKVNKRKEDKDIVYTMYEINLHRENRYDINLNLPTININSSIAKKINKDIEDTFGSKANSVAKSKDYSNIYNVDYVAYLQDGIISIAIKATLKEDNNPQRVIIKTYNYDIENDMEVGLDRYLLTKNLNKNDVYKKVISEIEKASSQSEAQEEYIRDKNDKRYLPENTDTFFRDLNNNLYLIYAYGNDDYTSELDMIIFSK